MQQIYAHLSRFTLAFLASFTSACAPVNILNSFVPDSGYELVSAIEYGSHQRQKLDIYLPKDVKNSSEKSSAARSVIIFYYGGNWDSGERADYKFAAEAFTSLGHIVVIPDYRLYPDVLFPGFMADPAKAAKWVKQNIKEYNGNADKIFLAGHSAGAHIAVMMAINPEYLAIELLKPNDFAGVIGLAGPYDFLPLKSKTLSTIFGSEAEQWKSQPINFVDGKNPPLLLAYGKKDDIVWPRNSINLAKKVEENNGLVQLVEFESYSHVDMVAKLAKPLRNNPELLKTIAQFIESQ